MGIDIEKVIKGLEICSAGEWNSTGGRDHTDCPYYPAGYTGCTCKLLMRDALALLKAQQPRVMTLKEAQALDDESVVWFEHKRIHSIHPRVVCSSCSTGIEFSDGAVWTYESDGYGECWRLWTSRPTAKRMVETPWES